MDSNDVRSEWKNRSGEYSPEYYAYYGPDDASEWIRSQVAQFVPPDASILELGCSSGRHLAHLAEHGFEDLHGIEINPDALDVMAENYPTLAAEGTFHVDSIEDVVPEFETDRFDAVYSVETLQHLHPDVAPVFDEIARVTGGVLVTVENETEDGSDDSAADRDRDHVRDVSYVNDEFPLYHRNWAEIFTARGFDQVATRQIDRDTARAFRTRE